MNAPPLAPAEIALLRGVFCHHPEISEVRLFGSRAKGTHAPQSDVDLALWGVDFHPPLRVDVGRVPPEEVVQP